MQIHNFWLTWLRVRLKAFSIGFRWFHFSFLLHLVDYCCCHNTTTMQVPLSTHAWPSTNFPRVLCRSSRLIFRNLPPSLTPQSLRSHLTDPPSASSSTTNLSECTITDLKHVAKRRFAFVGYVDEEQARRVKDWFDGTYLGSSKIKVEFVRDEVSPLPPVPFFFMHEVCADLEVHEDRHSNRRLLRKSVHVHKRPSPHLPPPLQKKPSTRNRLRKINDSRNSWTS